MAQHFDGYGMPSVDFGFLNQAVNQYDKSRLNTARERTLAELGQGRLDYGRASQALLAAGDTEGGLSLARLAEARSNRGADMAWRREQAEREQKNQDRSYELQRMQVEGGRTPPGFRRSADGNLEAIPNGPADPAYIERATEGKQKPRQFNVGDVTKLPEEGGKFGNISTFADTFDDKFAGYKSSTVGNVANTAGRYLPEGVVGEDIAKGAAWWQGYDRYKNVVRNELFGSALTAPEQAAFEKADINPGMDPKQIRNNLKIQKDIAANGLKRKANALISSGYDPVAISQAYGVDVKELGATATGRGKSTTAPAPSAPQFKSADEVMQMVRSGKLKSGDTFRDSNGDLRQVP